jgi:hypothetical protein
MRTPSELVSAIVGALGGRRSGKGWMVRCPAHDDRTPSMSVTERDGKVLVNCKAGCSQAEVIAALKALDLWPERERPEWTPAERAAWAKQQREIERDLPSARYWRDAAVRLAEETLDTLKTALFNPMLPWPSVNEIYRIECLLSRLCRIDGAELVQEYSWWLERYPYTTALMVRVARDDEEVRIQALCRYLGVPACATPEYLRMLRRGA